MFTVILLGERARQRLEEWRALFAPFEDAEQLAFCTWHEDPDVTSLEHSVPGLTDVITGRREWRVIAIDPDLSSPTRSTEPDNPFDYLVNRPVDDTGDTARGTFPEDAASEPMVRLAWMLLGYPPLGPRGFVPRVSYWDGATRERVFPSDLHFRDVVHEAEMSGLEQRIRRELAHRTDVRIQYEIQEYGEEARERHRIMAQRYAVRQSRPAEVVFVSTREPEDTGGARELRMTWGEGDERRASLFVERNGYPASCRFTVYDHPPVGHSDRDFEEMKFWLGVLSIAVNDLPASSLQAEQVYRIDVDLDEGVLALRLNEHLGLLTSVQDHVDAALQRRERPTDPALAEVLTQRPVHVSFDMLDAEGLRLPTAGYSWASDVPSSESSRWSDSFTALTRETATYMRKPRRALAASVNETRARTHRFRASRDYLSPIRQEEIAEELAGRAGSLMEPATARILDRERLSSILTDGDAAVRRRLSERMDRQTVTLTLVFVLLAWTAALVPYLIQSGFLGTVTLAWGLTLLAALLLVVFAAGTLALIAFRRRLTRVIREVNAKLRTFTHGVNSGATAFGSFLSDLVTFMHGKSLLISSSRLEAERQVERATLVSRRRDLERLASREKDVLRSLGRRIEIDAGSQSTPDVRDATTMERILWLPRGNGTAILNHSGQAISAPYDFIRRLMLVNLALREPLAWSASDNTGDPDSSDPVRDTP